MYLHTCILVVAALSVHASGLDRGIFVPVFSIDRACGKKQQKNFVLYACTWLSDSSNMVLSCLLSELAPFHPWYKFTCNSKLHV
jgi:hypothetical protein